MISLRCIVVAMALGFAGAATAQDAPSGGINPADQHLEPAAGLLVKPPPPTIQSASGRPAVEPPPLPPPNFDSTAQLRSEIEPLVDPNAARDVSFAELRDKRELIQRNGQRLDSRRLTLLEQRLEHVSRMRDLAYERENIERSMNVARGHLAYLEMLPTQAAILPPQTAEVEFQPLSQDQLAARQAADISRVQADVTYFEREFAQASSRYAVAQAEQQSIDQELEIIGRQQSYLRDKLNEVENLLYRNFFVDSEAAQYKLYISVFLAGLFFFVILGFFYTAGRHESIALSIFQNQAGLQFITLFSLVIAIILFAVLGILEGKELSALLGAISGYVLGRAASGQAAQEVTEEVKRLLNRSDHSGDAGRNPPSPSPAPPASPAASPG